MTPHKVYLATMVSPTGTVWVRVGSAPGIGRLAQAMVRHLPYRLTEVQCVDIHGKPLARQMAREIAKTLPRSSSINGWHEVADVSELAGIGPVAMKYTGSEWPWRELEVRR